jgi:hypothetical protein
MSFLGILKILSRAIQALLGKGGITSTSKVPSATAPVFTAIRQIINEKCSEKELVWEIQRLKER